MMSEKEQVEALVRIRKIRHKTDFAVTLVAFELDDKHNVIDHSRYIIISVQKYNTNTLTFYPNEVWRFVGKPDIRTITTDAYIGNENVIEVVSATLICESGDNFVIEVWKSDDYIGIGGTLARRLWETFGDAIYDLLDNGDKEPLLSILQEDVAANLIHVWNKKGLSKQIRWIELMGIPSDVGNRCVNYYRAGTITKIEKNPYALLPFSANWETVDAIAQEKFAVTEADPRRIFAAVEHSVHLGVTRSRKGHTAFTIPQVRKILKSVLKPNQIEDALDSHTKKVLVPFGDYLIPTGYFIQEKYLAIRIAKSISAGIKETFDHHYKTRLSHFESKLEFPLTVEQRAAIKKCIENQVTILTGGAGCGKTTTLVGMIDLLEYAGYNVIQMALSGRAALRMTESSGKEAMTIASFRAHHKVDSLPEKTCLVIDEASMVSLNNAFAILRRLPHRGKLILIGDPVQLPPIGAGLFFRPLSLLDETASHRIELTEVKRQSENTGIPKIAESIRHHDWPAIPNYAGATTGVSFIEANNIERDGATLKTFMELHSDENDTRILTPVKRTSSGTHYLNGEIQRILRASDKPCMLWSYTHEQAITTGFKLNDKVVFLKNDYMRGLRNGSLGTVVKYYDPIKGDDNLMDVLFDEDLVTLKRSDWDNVQLAYALTVHKAQGSQFDRVVIPIVDSILTDQSLIYTALTRSVDQAVFIGDSILAQRVTEAPPSASLRQVGIDALLATLIKNNKIKSA